MSSSKSIQVSPEIKALAESFVVRDSQPFTTSLDVAEKFGKLHKNVLRAYRNLECSDDFKQLNFEPTVFIDKNGDKQPMLEMTRDGFTMLAFGFTGKEAAKWREDYISAFNYMESKLREQEQHKQLDWQQTRNQGKLNRRSATDAYQRFIEYAEAQGSKNAQHYYVLFTNMVYAELGVPKERNIRDNLGARELIRIAAAEDLITDVIYEAIELEVEYHEIYRLAKIRVKNLVELLKKRISTDEVKRIAKIH